MRPEAALGAAAPRGRTRRVDRDYRKIGVSRIQLVVPAEEFDYYNGLLTLLAQGKHVDVLRAVQDRTLTLDDLAAADALGRLRYALADKLAAEQAARSAESAAAAALEAPPTDPLDRPLWTTALEEVIPGRDEELCSPETKRRYATSFRALRNRNVKGLGPNATFRDLAAVDWKALRSSWNRSTADWNHLRRALSAVLTALLGFPGHEFRQKLLKKIPLQRERPRVPRITPDLFWEIYDAMAEHARISIVVLVATGIRVGEYLRLTQAHLINERCEMYVPGTKTFESEGLIAVDPRYWPYIEAGVPAPLRYHWLRSYWIRACVAVGAAQYVPNPRRPGKVMYVGPHLHDLRHCLGQWATDLGAPEKAVAAMLRHATVATTRRYTRTGETRLAAEKAADALDSGRRVQALEPQAHQSSRKAARHANGVREEDSTKGATAGRSHLRLL